MPWVKTVDVVVYDTPGWHVFNWGDWLMLEIEGIGAGGSGGGSASGTYGGAGGSGCWARGRCARPANGQSTLLIGAGGLSIPAGQAVEGLQGGESAFNNTHFWRGALGGQQSASPSDGGDGGAGGIILGPGPWDEYIQGGQGQASSPPNWFPAGAAAPRGGIGGNNNQGGSNPGGGGAPGNSVFASGWGGNARIVLRRLVSV